MSSSSAPGQRTLPRASVREIWTFRRTRPHLYYSFRLLDPPDDLVVLIYEFIVSEIFARNGWGEGDASSD